MAAPVEKGQILAHKYRVEHVLGEGGMGVVVAALDTTLERKVAIKFLLPEYAQHQEASARFMREARAAVKIQSEHIARVIDVSTMDNGSPYMVMEFLHGDDLSQVLAQNGPLPVEDAVSYVLQACDAIAEAHAAGIVHRDLKPANLFLARQPDGSSKIKVLDFGISKNTLAVADGTDPSLTRTSSMMGSPLYMSPEQMRSTKDVDARTDIWSLGIILYELLEGDLPFNASSIPELSAKILLEEPEPISRVDVPVGLKQAIIKALAKDPNLRYPSIAEFSQALSEYGPRRLRNTLERISRLMVSAGLSQGGIEILPTEPPPDMAGTFPAGSAPTSTTKDPRVHSATSAGWGNTQGPEIPTNGGMLKWGLSAAAAVLLVGGGVGFLVWGGGEEPAAAPAVGSVAPADSATIDLDKPSAPSTETAPAQKVPSVKPAVTPAKEQELQKPKAEEAETAAVATVAAASASTPSPVPTAPKAPTAKRPSSYRRPKSTTTRPKSAGSKPKTSNGTTTRRPSPPKSIKDKFGGRK